LDGLPELKSNQAAGSLLEMMRDLITFLKETGERDRAWMGIAQEIEKLAQAKSK
jgi:hypothetical protein